MTEQNQEPSLFAELVIMLGTSAMQQMGKIINPMTGKTETSLPGAQATIDLLDMLDKKTKGNLDQAEARLLADTLTSIKLTYVETAKTQAPKQTDTPPQPDNQSGEASSEKEPIIPPPPADDKDRGQDKKFHKTYS
ncbi:MAG: DUF1844 domain-containing protein [Spartobacteria bacterium]|nr:DUF1844 domain-containing protein [Spartobacteria bacterium]